MDLNGNGPHPKIKGIARIYGLLGADCRQNIHTIVKETCLLLEGASAWYSRIDDETGSPRIQAGYSRPDGPDCNLPEDSRICGETIPSTGHHRMIVSDIETLPLCDTHPFFENSGLKSYAGCPVRRNESAIGSLCVFYTGEKKVSQDDQYLLQTLAAALSLEEERLFEKMELVRTMAGGVAHDLNNVLCGLVSYPEVVLMQLPGGSPLKDPIRFIHDAGLKANDMVQDLLILAGNGLAAKDIVSLNHAVQEYFNSASHAGLENLHPDITFRLTCEPDLPDIVGSHSHLMKIIANLVVNAAKAVHDNSGQVTVETFTRHVDSPLSGYDAIMTGNYAVLRICDSGTGFAAKDLNRIFEPFYLKKHMGRSVSGLGLPVVRNCTRDLNGYIDVTSSPEKGTIFELYFPAI